jgi:hypothetical protein
MKLYKVDHIDNLAVCNDGSPGIYYHRPGAKDGSNKCALLPFEAINLSCSV